MGNVSFGKAFPLGEVPAICGVYTLGFKDRSLYVGGSKNIRARVYTHISWLRKGKGQTKELQVRYDKFGTPKIKVLCQCSPEMLGFYEARAHDLLHPRLCLRSRGGTVGVTISEKGKKNMSEAARRKDQSCQSEAQLARWKNSESRKRNVDATRKGVHNYWESLTPENKKIKTECMSKIAHKIWANQTPEQRALREEKRQKTRKKHHE